MNKSRRRLQYLNCHRFHRRFYNCFHDVCQAALKCYRFREFTDRQRRNKYKNGKSLLQLAKVDTQNINWIRFSQESRY